MSNIIPVERFTVMRGDEKRPHEIVTIMADIVAQINHYAKAARFVSRDDECLDVWGDLLALQAKYPPCEAIVEALKQLMILNVAENERQEKAEARRQKRASA